MLHDLCKAGRQSDLKEFLTEISRDSEDKLSYFLGEKDELKYTPLHVAIFERNLDAVKILLEFGADCNAKCHGTPPLHLAVRTAAQPHGYDAGFAIFQEILKVPSLVINSKDDSNLSVVHLVSLYDFSEIAELFFQIDGAIELVNQYSQANGLTALHVAAFNDSHNTASILISKGAKLDIPLVLCGSSPLHCAATVKSERLFSLLLSKNRNLLNLQDWNGVTPLDIIKRDGWNFSNSDLTISPSRLNGCTAILHGNLCGDHHTCLPSDLRTSNAPPENRHRLHVLVDESDGILRSRWLNGQVSWLHQNEKCPISDVLRVHEWSYVRRIQSKCEQIPNDIDAEGGLGSLDGDTTLSNKTFEAALVACGAVCTAVDKVMSGVARNAFCAIRPPGHHAGPLGAVKSPNGSESHGFCFLNNVSIGAAYALNKHRDSVKKVAIVDFDVHHGNGTEETIRWLEPFCTVQEFANDNSFGKSYVPRYKPWFGSDDRDNVLFVSVHGYGPRQKGYESLFPQAAFYPGSGSTIIPDLEGNSKLIVAQPTTDFTVDDSESVHTPFEKSEDEDESASEEDQDSSVLTSDKDVNNGIDVNNLLRMYQFSNVRRAEPLILDIGVPLSYGEYSTPLGKLTEELKYRYKWRNHFREVILPRLNVFKPDLILISAGFDAHKKDTINAGYISLIEEDFQWVTDKLVEVANSTCNGRIVSVLEGGYQLGGEYTSAFAKSVFAHVQSLVYARNSQKAFNTEEMKIEYQRELEVVRTLEQKRDEDLERRQRVAKEMEEKRKLAEENQSLATSEQLDNKIKELPSDDANETSARKRKRNQVSHLE